MKCVKIPLLRRKNFLNIANNRDLIFKYSNRPINNFDRFCREWCLSHKSEYECLMKI